MIVCNIESPVRTEAFTCQGWLVTKALSWVLLQNWPSPAFPKLCPSLDTIYNQWLVNVGLWIHGPLSHLRPFWRVRLATESPKISTAAVSISTVTNSSVLPFLPLRGVLSKVVLGKYPVCKFQSHSVSSEGWPMTKPFFWIFQFLSFLFLGIGCLGLISYDSYLFSHTQFVFLFLLWVISSILVF